MRARTVSKKVVSKAMREKSEKGLTGLKNCQNGMFRLVSVLMIDSKDVEGGSCLKGIDGKVCFSEKERGKIRKDYMEMVKNLENGWHHNVEGDAVEGPLCCASRDEVVLVLIEMKPGKAPGHVMSWN